MYLLPLLQVHNRSDTNVVLRQEQLRADPVGGVEQILHAARLSASPGEAREMAQFVVDRCNLLVNGKRMQEGVDAEGGGLGGDPGSDQSTGSSSEQPSASGYKAVEGDSSGLWSRRGGPSDAVVTSRFGSGMHDSNSDNGHDGGGLLGWWLAMLGNVPHGSSTASSSNRGAALLQLQRGKRRMQRERLLMSHESIFELLCRLSRLTGYDGPDSACARQELSTLYA